jgi:hypothetical protein
MLISFESFPVSLIGPSGMDLTEKEVNNQLLIKGKLIL